MSRARFMTVVTLLAFALFGAACGGSSSGDDPETTTTGAQQVTTTTAAATTTAPAQETTTTEESTDTTVGGPIELDIAAEDSEGFTRDRLEAPAGAEVSVVFNNKDVGGEPHNWHIVVVPGTEEYASTIQDGPDTQTITFTIGTPGDYNFYCDTHSETMKGIFKVTP